MKVATVIRSDHADLSAGMRGQVEGEHAGGYAVRFQALNNSARGTRRTTTCWLAKDEVTLSDNAVDLPFLVSATLPPALLI